MNRIELAYFYMNNDVKLEKLSNLKEQKKILKQRLVVAENYIEMVETQLESVLDQIDYLSIYY